MDKPVRIKEKSLTGHRGSHQVLSRTQLVHSSSEGDSRGQQGLLIIVLIGRGDVTLKRSVRSRRDLEFGSMIRKDRTNQLSWLDAARSSGKTRCICSGNTGSHCCVAAFNAGACLGRAVLRWGN